VADEQPVTAYLVEHITPSNKRLQPSAAGAIMKRRG
jgi:hypothetical protein